MAVMRSGSSNFASVDKDTKGVLSTPKPKKFFYDEELTDGIWSEIVLIPDYGFNSISYDLQSDGECTVQATISPIELIEQEQAIWRDLPENVRINPSISAIRAKCDGANGYFVVRAS